MADLPLAVSCQVLPRVLALHGRRDKKNVEDNMAWTLAFGRLCTMKILRYV